MSRIIAGIYEIQNEIGAGGGGVVYLGSHLRLKKPVVLKADRRRLSTDMETLRREVDLLKGLSQTYIPQVYDFIEEDGVVYTVMDYVEGESLDKLLKRKQPISQPEIIKWACQLLEALDYLHGQPPHGILHGDIKPANIMLRPDGDICLIDFNIALALGEDGAVKVGFSRGYASPEHYGASYISENKAAAVERFSHLKSVLSEVKQQAVKEGKQQQAEEEIEEATQRMGEEDSEKTLLMGEADRKSAAWNPSMVIAKAAKGKVGLGTENSMASVGSSTSRRGGILLDVRSDIYSLGATLYHLLSGHRPAQEAQEVVALSQEICSPQVAWIIKKAMAPDPAMRYQTANEMLTAFLQLPQKDGRVIRHKRRAAVAIGTLGLCFLAGGACSFLGLKQLEQRQKALTQAEYSANSLAKGDVNGAVKEALAAIGEGSILDAPITAEAQKALTDALGVYDLSDGFKAFSTIELPSAPFSLKLSPEGTRLAVVYGYEVALFDLNSEKKLATLPIQKSALSDVVFAAENRIIYAGQEGISHYEVDSGSTLWSGDRATTLALSADGSRIAALNREENSVILYATKDGEKITERSLGDLQVSTAANDIFTNPQDDIFALNQEGTLLAVSLENGGLILLDLENPNQDRIVYEESDYRYFEGGFYQNYFAFSAGKSDQACFGLIDTRDGEWLAGYESQDNILLQVDERGIYLANGKLLVSIQPEGLKEQELAYTDNAYITAFGVQKDYALVATEDGGFSFFDSGANLVAAQAGENISNFAVLGKQYAVLANRDEPTLRLLRLEKHEDAQFLTYDARYEHDEARISANGQKAMLFSYQSFRIYDKAGGLVAQVELPEPENIYDQQYLRENGESKLEVIWYDGTRRYYSGEDGSLIGEEKGEAPDKGLEEEFYVGKYRIVSSLHGTPQVYEAESGRLVASLEEEAYLTYVTQIEEYMMTEYISTTGERYGILLNEKLQKLAYLPGLCDVWEDMLVFDYQSGNLRQCRLYSLQELIALGETYEIQE